MLPEVIEELFEEENCQDESKLITIKSPEELFFQRILLTPLIFSAAIAVRPLRVSDNKLPSTVTG